MADDLLLVGRVARPHGIRGQVIVNPETDFAGERFTPGQTLLVGPPGHTVARRIVEARFHKGRPIVAFEDVATMNDAEALAGAELWMPQAEMAPLPAGTFYRHDLVGCEVRDRAGTVIGEVSGSRRHAGTQLFDRQGSARRRDDPDDRRDLRHGVADGAADRGRRRRTGCSRSIAAAGERRRRNSRAC